MPTFVSAQCLAVKTMLLGVLATVSAGQARAQAPLVFVHGLNSGQTTWGTFPTDVQSAVPVIGRAANLSSFAYYDDQTVQLRNSLPSLFNQGPLGNLIAVGHSNGGMIGRGLAKSQPVQGLITIGTPHRGALLATGTFKTISSRFCKRGCTTSQIRLRSTSAFRTSILRVRFFVLR